MPLFSVASRSEAAVICWRSNDTLKAVEYETLGHAEDAWSTPSLLFYPCVLFLQKRDGDWVVWRSYGLRSSVRWIKAQFDDPDVRSGLLAPNFRVLAPVFADHDPTGAVARAPSRVLNDVAVAVPY